ncbi:MAG: mechanosensitive ion channel domain-containing protein [Acidobacteriota bacterium]
MHLIQGLRDHAVAWVTITLLLAALVAVRWLLAKRFGDTPGQRARNQAILLVLILVAVVIVILVVPGIDQNTRGNLLGLFGIIASGAIALSSTTFLGNAMAGLMLRSMQHYRPGDYLGCGDHFCRVSEQGLFHTEIQTQDRDLTTLPNLFLVTNPVTVVSSGGTIVSAEIGLGYDVPRLQVEKLLLEAAAETGLEDAFVSVMELQDHAVVYRVAGLLSEVRELISTRSRLRKRILDTVHGAGVEIVSPGFVVVREPSRGAVVPKASTIEEAVAPAPEAILFDKADLAGSVESLRDVLAAIEHEIVTLGQEGEAADSEQDQKWRLARRGRLEGQRDRLQEQLAAAESELEQKR